MRRSIATIAMGAALGAAPFAYGAAPAAPAPAAAAPAAAPAPAPAPAPPYGAPVSVDQARRIIAAAEAHARANGWQMAFAVVEPNGTLVAFERMDGVQYGSVDVAQAKARTAARFKRPSRAFADQVTQGRLGVMSLDGVVAVAGGVPIVIDGRTVGAIGGSGGSSDQDEQAALAGIAALKP